MLNTKAGTMSMTWHLHCWLRRLHKTLSIRKCWRKMVCLQEPQPTTQARAPLPPPALGLLREGDRVRVRPQEQIERTLDETGRLKGCAWLPPMLHWCNKELRVKKVVRQFFDERRWRMLRCHNIVLLEGTHCDGSGHPDTSGCDRMCLFFWRTEWLQSVDVPTRANNQGISKHSRLLFVK